jgi:tetratricopeptide (TPR) repeat protein
MLKGTVAQKRGQSKEASAFFTEGDYIEHYVNFNQMELVPVVMAASDAGNGFASFLLGNFYYHNMMPDKAIAMWRMADSKHPGDPQILRNLALYAKYQEKDPSKSRELLRQALKINPSDLFIRKELIAAEKNCGASAGEILEIYLEAPKEQRDSYLFQHGLLQTFMDAGKWKEAAEYLQGVDRKWSGDVSSWYYFCVCYADWLVDNSKPGEALEWIEKSSAVPPNLSDVKLPADYFYRQQEYYVAGVACKMLGDKSGSLEYFRRAADEQTDFLFNESAEERIQELRFYVALALKELGMGPASSGILGSINQYRLKRGLIVLSLDKGEMKKWDVHDPLAEPAPPPAEH